MASAAVDVQYLSGHLGLTESLFTSLPDNPSLSTLLEAVATKAREFDSLYAEKLRVDIELENALTGAETRCQSFKASADKAMKEVDELRIKLQQEESSRLSLQNECQMVKSSLANAESEISSLRQRVDSLQESNRSNLSVLESRNAREKELSEELATQHQKNVQLNKELTTCQQASQAAQSAASSAKYRAEMLQQQLSMAQKNTEWLEAEIKTKCDEALKHRKEKGARIAQLQRENDEARSEIESLQRVAQQLRERLANAQAKSEEAAIKAQRQQEAFARTEESYKQELENHKRLVEMSDQLSRKHQNRLQEIEVEKERLRDNNEHETNTLRVELEKERSVVTGLETKIAQLEGQVGELEARIETPMPSAPTAFTSSTTSAVAEPQTPRLDGSMVGRAMSPFGTPGSVRGRSGLTATQAVEELYKVKGLYRAEQRRSDQLNQELDTVVAMLEARAPQINELQEENDNLKMELERMSQMTSVNFEERDAAIRNARKAQTALSTAQTETKILRGQLRDLGTQIQMLLFNMHAHERGFDHLTDEEKYRFEQLCRGEVTEDALSDLSDTHQFISQKFVVFKDIQELQQKNEELLRLTRELADQMESEEAVAAKQKALDDHKTVERLQQDLESLGDEARSLKTTMESYKAERDMFRRLLQQKASSKDLASILGESVVGDGEANDVVMSHGDEVTDESNGNTKTIIQQMQSSFDSFREEQTAVRESLQAQVRQLSTDKNSLHAEVVKLNSQLTLASERYELLHSNFTAIQKEMEEVQKRNNSLSEGAAKQDIRTQQVAEDLVEARGLVESMRNENANLKAEKQLWKSIQERLSKDHEVLTEEKTHLNNLLASQQSLLNERDLAETESRRKMQTTIDTLEQEVSTTKTALSKESEERKQLQLRKDFELGEAQKRIDDLLKSLSAVREDHVSVRTSRDHLQARVDELSIHLRNAEDRADRLAPRPTPRASVAPVATEDASAADDRDEVVQELQSEILDLKRDLDIAWSQLENANSQVEQYKKISQDAEEALEEIAASQEQVKIELDGLLDGKDKTIRDLQQRLDDLSQELSSSNSELSSLRDSQHELSRRFEDEKSLLEDELRRLKTDTERYVEERKYHQQDLRAQADIAAKAQEDYEKELVKHAEAAKMLQTLRLEYNALKDQTMELRVAADSAKVALTQNEESWKERQQQLEEEIKDLGSRREDANQQNKLLHAQLDGVQAQIAALQQKRSDDADRHENGNPEGHGSSDADGLRELNGYLRREKDILEVQYDMKVQECRRIQQQLDYAQSQLDETRLKLEEERQSHSDNKSSLSHQDLMSKLHELNLYRESSATLRNELNQARSQISEKTQQIESLEARLSPLESALEMLRSEKSYLEEEVKQIQDDRDRWQKRTEGILAKYGRVDPAEMDELKGAISKLEEERDTLRRSLDEARAHSSEVEASFEVEKAKWQETREKIVAQAKERSRKLTGEKNDVIQRSTELQDQLTSATQELLEARANLVQSNARVAELERELGGLQLTINEVRAAASSDQDGNASTQPELPKTDKALSSDDNDREVPLKLLKELADYREKLATCTEYKNKFQNEASQLRERVTQLEAERQEAIEKLQQAQAQLAAAHTSSSSNAESVPGNGEASQETTKLSDEERRALERQIAEAESKVSFFEAKANELDSKMQETIRQRCDKMRETLNNKLKESRGKIEEEFNTRLEQERAIWAAENGVSIKSEDAIQQATPRDGTSTPSKPSSSNQGAASTSTAATTPSTEGNAGDFSQLGDADVRKLLQTNATLRSIFTANVKKKVDQARTELEQKLSTDQDRKVSQAREQGQLMESKKSTVRMNMMENKLNLAQYRVGLVETAATDTPQKPVVEVWDVVKVARPPPPTAATPASTTAPASSTPASSTPNATPAISVNNRDSTPTAAKSRNGSMATSAQETSKPTPPSSSNANAQPPRQVPVNPFSAASSTPSGQPGGNPFLRSLASHPLGNAPPNSAPPGAGLPQQQQPGAAEGKQPDGNATSEPPKTLAHPQQQTKQQQQQQQQQQQPLSLPAAPQQNKMMTAPSNSGGLAGSSHNPRSALPIARGGGTGGGGGGRGRGNFRGGIRGGFGGPRGGASNAMNNNNNNNNNNNAAGNSGLNAAATEFQSGNKRPRNEGDGAQGVKRPRGGAGASTGAH